ncbi:MAG: SDR family NAD(P)-dependent oxidoreductase [Alphaproteobacteria bacterium]|nr:SDR family NAD(P)-dependent oxidoreductase [Alphaproteobacteria bacterium]
MASPLKLDGKIALVTGASRGIGAAIATALAGTGAKLALTAQTLDDVTRLAEALKKKHGADCLVHAGDVADAASVQALYKQIFDRFGRLDILAANAGILGDGLLGMLPEKDIRRTLDTNILGTINHLQQAARLMRRNKSGSIIITSSIIGRAGNKGQVVYAASKAALIGAALSAAKELGPDGIRVNAIAPGMIETDMTKHLSAEICKERLSNIALGRFGTPDEVADVALFLASDLARYVTGQVIGIDGGMVI